jgi:hypothetical protein
MFGWSKMPNRTANAHDEDTIEFVARNIALALDRNPSDWAEFRSDAIKAIAGFAACQALERHGAILMKRMKEGQYLVQKPN